MFSFVLFSANATTWYVDSSVSSSGNGTSWTTAWKNISNITGVHAGDTIYISGGASGSSQTYALSGTWTPTGGTSGSPITYQIGQDAAHNGTAVFSGSGAWFSSGSQSYLIVSGNAGDGKQHFATSGFSTIGSLQPGSLNIRISYVNFGQIGGGINDGNGAAPMGPGFEFDHNYVYINYLAADHFSYMVFNTAAWDANWAHDNQIYVPRTESGTGADCFQWNGSGFTISNNTIVGYAASYTGGQHQDGLQPTGGSYIRVCNNTFVNLANYPVFGDAYYSDFAHFWVYNNVLILSDSGLQASPPPQGIAIGPDGGAEAQMGRWPNFTDIVVANNVIDGYGGHASISVYAPAGTSGTFTGCVIANNISANGGGINSAPANTTVDNVLLSVAQAQSDFVSYTANAGVDANGNPLNNYHLTSAATSLIGKGANESSYFTTDKDGNVRPASGAWDIGPYQYSSTGTNVPPTTNYTITASAGTGGSISPSGSVSVNAGNSQTFTITASSGYQISGVTVDGANVGAVSTYTFSNVQASHTIAAAFSVTSGVTPPSAPTSLSANPVSPSEIDLSWTAATAGTDAIAGYHIYVNGASTPAASVTTTSYKSTGLSANTAYAYTVTAYDTAGDESPSATVSATTWPPLSTNFYLNEQVQILATANVRQQPANELAGAVIGSQPAGSVATIVGGPIYAAINNVYYYWWNLSFGTSPSGWVAEDNLQAYAPSVNPAIEVTPGSVAFGTILSGTSRTNSFLVQNVGAGTLNGSATVGSPFSVISGGSYSLGAGQTQAVVLVFSPVVASNYNQNVTFTGGGGTNVVVSGSATNAPVLPGVSAIHVNAGDVDPSQAGLQIYSGTTVQFSATATNARTWQWSYAINGGAPVVYTNSTSPITNVNYYFDTNSVGNSYVWTLVVSNGTLWAESQTNFAVEALPNAGGPVTNGGLAFTATSVPISGLLKFSTLVNGVPVTYIYQPLASFGDTSGGTAVYNFTITNAGNYEIVALVNAPSENANSFYVNIDSPPQGDSTMIWDIMPITSGFEQRLLSWRGNGSENHDQIVPKIFNLSAGPHQIFFEGREPYTALSSFSLVPLATTMSVAPHAALAQTLTAPDNLRVVGP